MLDVIDGILREAIAAQPVEFDSHAVIRQIMRIAPRAYADDPAATNGDDPIWAHHDRSRDDSFSAPTSRRRGEFEAGT